MEPVDRKERTPISPKLAFGTVAGFGVVVLLFGFVSLGQSINGPAKSTSAVESASISAQLNSEELFGSGIADQLSLQGQDTDQDGLSDYDEINVYLTSPYLPDSDSDGFTDAQEVEAGHDPNCPAGQNCREPVDAPASEVDVGNELFGDLLPDVDPISSESSLEAPALNNLSGDDLRDILLQSGQVSAAQLDQIDDETLFEAYQAVLQQQE